RAANDRVRAAQAAEFVARTQAESWHGGPPADEDDDDDEGDEGDSPYMPSEFPERWSRFLPPDDVKSRLQKPGREKDADRSNPYDE
ncbi:YihY/virulence factor BrkB family protein, partial [Streptomyces sp. SID2563]|nr:YihY/virulence factor BrkB family protein [Streptomyces sp. SID2563]